MRCTSAKNLMRYLTKINGWTILFRCCRCLFVNSGSKPCRSVDVYKTIRLLCFSLLCSNDKMGLLSGARLLIHLPVSMRVQSAAIHWQATI